MKKLLMLLLTAALAACGQEQKTAAPTLVHVVFVTDWKAQAEHGGFYEALAEGLYKKRGLDVTIMEGGPSVNVPQLLAGGAATFGIGSNGFIPLNMVKQGVAVRAVMAVFQKDPQVLMTHPRADIRGLADMKGKPIMIADASIAAFWPWLKAKYGFSDTQIRKYTFNLAPFLTDANAIQEGYLTSEPYTVEKQAGFKPQVYLLADNGYPGYANMVLVPDDWIAKHPAAVQAFVDASIEGWMDYLYGDPAPANALIERDNPDMTADTIAQARDKMKSYGLAMGGDAAALGLGAMTEARWKTFFETMADEGLYDKNLDWRKAFDTRFVDKKLGLGKMKP